MNKQTKHLFNAKLKLSKEKLYFLKKKKNVSSAKQNKTEQTKQTNTISFNGNLLTY